jgi:hypothetical protein
MGVRMIWVLPLVAVVFAVQMSAAKAGEVRYHGVQFSDQGHLLVEQLGPAHLKLAVRDRTRPEGGLNAAYTRLEGQAETGRIEGLRYLAEIRVERIKPAGANYLQSSSERYRFRVQGTGVGPFYQSVREVHAADARQAMSHELHTMAGLTSGDDREALVWAGPIVLAVLKEAGHMPAPLYTTVEESTAGRYRIRERSLQRRELPGGRQLGIGPLGQPVTRLTGREAVEAGLVEESSGGPSPRAGASSFEPPPVRAGNIRPGHIGSKEAPRAGGAGRSSGE